MTIINKEVNHSLFGKGKILSQEGERLSVQFSEEYGIRQFGYPDVFEKHMKFKDTNLETAVLLAVSFKQDQAKAENERKQHQYEENRINEKLELAELKKKKPKKIKA